jgi:hypothetical protein
MSGCRRKQEMRDVLSSRGSHTHNTGVSFFFFTLKKKMKEARE